MRDSPIQDVQPGLRSPPTEWPLCRTGAPSPHRPRPKYARRVMFASEPLSRHRRRGFAQRCDERCHASEHRAGCSHVGAWCGSRKIRPRSQHPRGGGSRNHIYQPAVHWDVRRIAAAVGSRRSPDAKCCATGVRLWKGHGVDVERARLGGLPQAERLQVESVVERRTWYQWKVTHLLGRNGTLSLFRAL
jgi:hypothetical protein